jgi:transposase InsO family protein
MNRIRKEFVTEALLEGANFAGLCRQYGISRKTGYKWRERALAEGLNRLAEHSRRPKRSPRQLEEEAICLLVRLKLCHPAWGPKKICQLFGKQRQPVPSLSSCQRVLARTGLVQARARRRRPQGQRLAVGAVARAPNQVWTVDFKGWWRTADGCRCEPLTVRDAFSRFVLAVRTMPKADTATVQDEFARLFATYGLPEVIKSDNGVPFASVQAPLGLSRLSAWWVALGIDLDRSRPASPQDNGGHERLHRDIAAEVSRYAQQDLPRQQAALDLWREQFNWERPHEALGGRCPGECYAKSSRPFPLQPPVLDYPEGFFPRKIKRQGALRWAGQPFQISTALAGWHVGLRYLDCDHLEVWFCHLLLGHIELSTASFQRAASRPLEAASPSSQPETTTQSVTPNP